MILTSTEQLFMERPLNRLSLHNAHFFLFPVTSVKRFLCNVIGFPIFHLSEAATGGALRNFAKFTRKHLCQSPFF